MGAGTDPRRERLLARRHELLATVDEVGSELKGLETEVEIDIGELGQEETMARLLSRLDVRARLEVEEIDQALGRLGAGTYGLCETCGREIAPARLAALPTARTCLACIEAKTRQP